MVVRDGACTLKTVEVSLFTGSPLSKNHIILYVKIIVHVCCVQREGAKGRGWLQVVVISVISNVACSAVSHAGNVQVGPDRMQKLQNVLEKVFGRFGTIVRRYYPIDENTKMFKG